jgi:hypothetical protein
MILEVIKAPNTPKIAATVPPKIWAKNHSGDEFFDSQYWSTINKARNPNHGIAAPHIIGLEQRLIPIAAPIASDTNTRIIQVII